MLSWLKSVSNNSELMRIYLIKDKMKRILQRTNINDLNKKEWMIEYTVEEVVYQRFRLQIEILANSIS